MPSMIDSSTYQSLLMTPPATAGIQYSSPRQTTEGRMTPPATAGIQYSSPIAHNPGNAPVDFVAVITTGTWCCRVEWILVCAGAHGVITTGTWCCRVEWILVCAGAHDVITTGTWCCRVERILVCAGAHGVIEEPAELTRIIEWAKRQVQEPPLSVCAVPTISLHRKYSWTKDTFTNNNL